MKSSVETIIADAHAFIMQNEKKYDLICMDVFVDDVIPNKFQNESFLEALRAALTADGILLYNRLARTKKDLALTDAFFNGPFRSQFPEAHYLDVNGNWMLMNRQVAFP